MKENNNADYYQKRAREEEASALATTNVFAAAVHQSLAERYRAKAWECENSQPVRLVCH